MIKIVKKTTQEQAINWKKSATKSKKINKTQQPTIEKRAKQG